MASLLDELDKLSIADLYATHKLLDEKIGHADVRSATSGSPTEVATLKLNTDRMVTVRIRVEYELLLRLKGLTDSE